MKKIINFVLVSASVLLGACMRDDARDEKVYYDTVQVVDNLVIDDNSVPIFPKKAALTTDTARRFSIELPRRCTVNWDNQSVV